VPQAGTYRTLCVRTCDGFYYPISFSTVPTRFPEDERACQRTCPATEVMLFTHRNPGEDVNQAVSLSGRAYRDLPNAFHYRQTYDSACSCRRTRLSSSRLLIGPMRTRCHTSASTATRCTFASTPCMASCARTRSASDSLR